MVQYDWTSKANGEKRFTNYIIEQDLEKRDVRSLLVDSQGDVWAGTPSGVKRFNGKYFDDFELPFDQPLGDGYYSNRTIFGISEDSHGHIWFGTNGHGAFRYDGEEFTHYTEEEGLSNNEVDIILEDRQGHYWFGTRFGGVSKYDGLSFTNFKSPHDIGNNEVCEVYEDRQGHIWLSSEGYGVYKYDGTIFTNYGEEEGLGVRAVQTIYQDNKDRIWVGGGGGLYRLEGERFVHVTRDGPW